MQKRILCIIGTRPEAIKMASVVAALRAKAHISTTVVLTGQHADLLDQTLKSFTIQADLNLEIMTPGQSLAALKSRLIAGIDRCIIRYAPDLVVAQGDTSSTFAAAMAAFCHGIPFAHVEAGLRSGQIDNPFPEEFNRQVITRCSTLHFAPTDIARHALLAEGIAASDIFMTGNPGIDALMAMAKGRPDNNSHTAKAGVSILLTLHRRENFGEPAEQIFAALGDIAASHRDLSIFYPVHLNPAIQALAIARLDNVPGIQLMPPQDYPAMIELLAEVDFVATDSGGLLEEAVTLGKPVLILRDTTERPEAIAIGGARLIGTGRTAVVEAMDDLIRHRSARIDMSDRGQPYGDGSAGQQIADHCADHLSARQARISS